MSPTPPRPTPQNVRTTRKPPRGVLQVDWPFFGELCRALALKIFRDYDPELVIGIAKAGAIPGSVGASILQRDFASMPTTRAAGVARRLHRNPRRTHLDLVGHVPRAAARVRDGERGPGRLRARAAPGLRLGRRLLHLAGATPRDGRPRERAVARDPGGRPYPSGRRAAPRG